MDNKFVGVVAVCLFLSMAYAGVLMKTISQDTFLNEGTQFCESYSGIHEYWESSILGGIVLCNDWDPVNKGLFGQDIRYQIHIDKDGEKIKDTIADYLWYGIILLTVGMILDRIFDKKFPEVEVDE